MSDLSYYANNPYWMNQIQYAQGLVNDGHYVKFQQGSQGGNYPMHIYANPVAFTYLKHGQETINPYNGGVTRSFDPNVSTEMNEAVQDCINSSLNPVRCQMEAARYALYAGKSRPQYWHYN